MRLPETLMRKAKRYASDHGMTFTMLVAEGLTARLTSATGARKSRSPGPMPTFRGGGLRPGITTVKTSELLDLTEKRRGSS